MDSELRGCKRAIRIFLRTAYTNERLTWLLAHARSGKLVYQSCCCLVGLPTSDHALVGKMSSKEISKSRHYWIAKAFLGAPEAEWAYYRLGLIGGAGRDTGEELRRRRLIPMVLAEIERRARKEDRAGPGVPSGMKIAGWRGVNAPIL